MRKILLLILALPKSFVFNLKYFPLSVAMKLPVLVSHRVWLKQLSGTVTLDKSSFGSVLIGFNDVGIFDKVKSRSIWEVSGEVNFRGRAKIGHGSKLSVSGILDVGDGFVITAESSIIANKHVKIGENVLVSWEVLIMDTDFHPIYCHDEHINPDMKIEIGQNVWIGCRCIILKGSVIPDGNVIGAGTTVSNEIEVTSSILLGVPLRVVKSGITWSSHAHRE